MLLARLEKNIINRGQKELINVREKGLEKNWDGNDSIVFREPPQGSLVFCTGVKSQRSQSLRTLRIFLLLFQGGVIFAVSLSILIERETAKITPPWKSNSKICSVLKLWDRWLLLLAKKRDYVEGII